MNVSEPRPPQVALVSSAADRARVQPLVDGLRREGLEVWWDGDGLTAGELWEAKTWAQWTQAPVNCLLLSQAALKSKFFLRAVDQTVAANRMLIPIVLEWVNRESLPLAVQARQWVDFSQPELLRDAVSALTQAVRGLASTGGPASASVPGSPPPGPVPGPPVPPPGVELLLGDATEPEIWLMSADLAGLIAVAARFHPTVRGQDSVRWIPFVAFVDALFIAATAWRDWAEQLRTRTGGLVLATQSIGTARGGPPWRLSRSSAQLFRSARQYAESSKDFLDVPHLIAALIHASPDHEEDLAERRFDLLAWANALADEATRRSHPAAALFTALRDQQFPTSPPPAPVAISDVRLQRALGVAQGLAQRDNASGQVGAKELFAGIVWAAQREDRELIDLLVAEAPHLQAASAQALWHPFFIALGIASQGVDDFPIATSMPLHTAELAAVFSHAQSLRALRKATETADLEIGDVFFALWMPSAPGLAAPIDPVLEPLRVDGNAFLRRIAALDDADVVAPVIQHLLRQREPLTPWSRPHLDNDRVHGAIAADRDHLDVSRPALRFAKLLAAVDVRPPVALGLFGNWGAGKSFFMGLMRQGIAELAASGDAAYVRRPVQIEFNAWHYHDTNLWASLAVRIFEGLAKNLGGNSEDEVERKRRELHRRVSSSTARRQEAENLRTQALKRRTEKTETLAREQAEREAKRQASQALRLVAAWEAVRKDDAFTALRQAADGVARHFGLSASLAAASDLQRLRTEVVETRERAYGLFTAVGRRFHDLNTGARTTGMLVLIATAALSLGWGVEAVASWLKAARPDFSAAVVQVAAMVSSAAAWCGRRVRETQGVLDQIGKVEAALAQAEAHVEPTPAMQALQTEIQALDKTIHQAGEELSAAEREIAAATAEIDRINRGGLVYDFLQDRRNAASYLGQLGLVSTIRQDLEQLGALLKDFKGHSPDAIDRIVLYIDDLDRCHPDKVVEVLQAVHLLLAFDLFNVVVGVDARWLERSLRRQYGDKGQTRRADDPFSPHDYLEKIFQIPYSLSPIGEAGFRKLIDGLIETRSEWEGRRRQSAAAAAAGPNPPVAAPPAVAITTPVAAPAVDAAAPPPPPPPPASTLPANEPAAATPPAAPPAAAAVPLYFEDHEQAFIERLHAFIDRPRLAKRFINIYRLLRVRADDEQETARFNGDAQTGEFRAAATLLAIQVGHPAVAMAVLRAIDQAPAGTPLASVVRSLAATPDRALDALQRRELAPLAEKLQQLSEHLPTDLAAYQRWCPRVACFAFDWHRPTTSA